MARLKGKLALITGAARGIGAATARLFHKEGASVIVTDKRDDLGNQLCKDIGKGAFYYHLDVKDATKWENVSKDILQNHGKVDILFNNAGILGLKEKYGPQDPENCSLETWQDIHAVNLNGVFLGCRMAILHMKEKGGSIINMSSRSGMVGVPTACAYASSKAAIRNHTKSVALYCAQMNYNIRCNSLHPGAVLTDIWSPVLGEDTKKEQISSIAAGIPLGRMGEPNDVAYAALYLASDESKYITGAEFTIDGGILAGSASAPNKPKKS